MNDYDGETSNEATNQSFFSVKSPEKAGLSPNTAARAVSVAVPPLKSLSQRWCTGENIAGPEIVYTAVPNSVYKHAIYLEGKYQVMLTAVLRMQGYGGNVGGADELDYNLEVIKRPVCEENFTDAYQAVHAALQAKVQAALQVPVVESPAEYRKLRSEGRFAQPDEAVPAAAKKRKDSRGAMVGPDTTANADSQFCQHAHRFPVQVQRHDDACLVSETRCDHLHMRLNEEKDTYELCRCLESAVASAAPVSLFAAVTKEKENANAARSNTTGSVPYCANCQAVRDNLPAGK